MSRCAHCGSFIVCQWRNAFKRRSSIHSGSPFFSEMSRTTSSFSPRPIVSVAISDVKPYL